MPLGGYFAASGLSALLQPVFGWRILWLLNLPTGLSLVLLGAFIPESAKFLLARGRREEARRVMERTGARFGPAAAHALMDLGATVCLARVPRCERCPLASECPFRFFRQDSQRFAGHRDSIEGWRQGESTGRSELHLVVGGRNSKLGCSGGKQREPGA